MAVHRNARKLVDLAAESDHLQTEELVERYGNQWLATARRSSPTAADAEDAYQRALETLLTNPPAERDPEGIAAWMHTVIRNEALQIMRSRRREIDTEFDVIVGGLAADVPEPEESMLDAETHGASKEALRRLRPDQTRCLLLRADGFGYPEICSITGFSYAKVNRLLSEGRKAARLRVGAIEAGRECERIEPLLSMIADGVADPADASDAQLHLENCTHCRSTLRDYTLAPRDLAAALPLGVVAADSSWWDRLFEPFHRVAEFLQGRASDGSSDSTLAAGKKVLAVLAVGATAVGGGAVVHQARSGDDKQVTRAATVPVSAPGPSARQLEARKQRVAARRRERSQAQREREARVAAAADAERASESRSAEVVTPLNPGAGVEGGTADDPATDAAPDGADGTDGQAEGLAP